MQVFGCDANKIRCLSGAYFNLADPVPEDVDIRDIAKALSNTCRFGGRIDGFYSVAEHLVNCAEVAIRDGHEPSVVFAVLMHDAAEAYVGDVVRPLKAMLPEFKVIEERVERAIELAFGIDFSEHKSVIHEIDNAVLIAERDTLLPYHPARWNGESECRQVKIKCRCLEPQSSYFAFINMFEKYRGKEQYRPKDSIPSVSGGVAG